MPYDAMGNDSCNLVGGRRGSGIPIYLTCEQALPLSLMTRGEEGLKHSFDGSHVKRTDSDLFS